MSQQQTEQLKRAEKKISSLEAHLQQSQRQEKIYYDEILVYHRRSAKLQQDLLVANKKSNNILVLAQKAELQNKTLKKDLLEACQKVCIFESKISTMEKRGELLEKKVENMHQQLEQMEGENSKMVQKLSEYQATKKLLEERKRKAVDELYELQAKNSELEVTLQLIARRTCTCSGKDSELCAEELMECDREIATHSNQLDTHDREEDDRLERLRDMEREALESERRNSKLRQEVAQLTLAMTEKDHHIRQCKQLFESTRRNYQDEISKLEGSVYKWQTKYKQCLIDLEKETMNKEDHDPGKSHQSCLECELNLRACQSDITERDVTIAYLQKINKSHEDKIRQILNQYKKSDDVFNDKLLSYDSSLSDLHHQLQLLLAFHKTRSENALAELVKWKELAVEARLCREKETSLFESQLSLISKEYYAKYENCRCSYEREKSRRSALEGQTQRLTSELEECRKQLRVCRDELDEVRRHRESLITVDNNIINNITVTQPECNTSCFGDYENTEQLMADNEMESPELPSDEPRQEMDTEFEVKHENTDCERDRQDIVEISDPIEDAVHGTTATNEHTKPVVPNSEMETANNGIASNAVATNGAEKDVNQSMAFEVQTLRMKNSELQLLCDRLMRERNEKAAGDVLGQQSTEPAVKCETQLIEIQDLKQQLEQASLKLSTLEKANCELIAENQRLETLVRELQSRIPVAESENKVVDAKVNMENSAEVDGPRNDAAKEIEDALNESFAAQDISESSPEATGKTEVDGSTMKEDGTHTVEETIQEEPPAQKETTRASPHASLTRNKLPSAASTAPIPFGKRHSHAGFTSRTSRPRAGSTEFGTAIDRRASVGSDSSDAHVDEEGKPKQPPVKKYSTSHLDAFKPKPFMKKQTSLSDDMHLYSRSRINSKPSGSTGSASDTESLHDNQQETTSPVETEASNSTQNQTETMTKQPPETLPKPHKPHSEAKPDFQSGFSYKEYMSGIHPPGDSTNKASEQPPDSANTGELV